MEKDLRKLPIGVFDSGIGGLTVLDEFIKMFPNEDFYYIGDTLNLPYGVKTNQEVENLVTNICTYLEKLPVKIIVIACNTATVNSIHLKNILNIPYLGVIEPTAKYALKHSENILVIATNITINSNIYKKIIDENKQTSSTQYYVACSEFVDAIESNLIDCNYSYELVSNKLGHLKDKLIDTIILGCTHFGLYEKELKNVFNDVTFIPCSKPTSLDLKDILVKNNLLNPQKELGKISINLTKEQENFYKKTEWFDHSYDFKIIKI